MTTTTTTKDMSENMSNLKSGLNVTLIATRAGWLVISNATENTVNRKAIQTAAMLVQFCNDNHLNVTNPDAVAAPYNTQFKFRTRPLGDVTFLTA